MDKTFPQRAIFRWITVKDLNVMTFCDSIKQDTPLGILRGIKFGTETYHTLFMRLCRFVRFVIVFIVKKVNLVI